MNLRHLAALAVTGVIVSSTGAIAKPLFVTSVQPLDLATSRPILDTKVSTGEVLVFAKKAITWWVIEGSGGLVNTGDGSVTDAVSVIAIVAKETATQDIPLRYYEGGPIGEQHKLIIQAPAGYAACTGHVANAAYDQASTFSGKVMDAQHSGNNMGGLFVDATVPMGGHWVNGVITAMFVDANRAGEVNCSPQGEHLWQLGRQ